MDDFPSNSTRSPRPRREELREKEPAAIRPPVQRVVEGEVIRRKKPMAKRIKEALMPDENMSMGEWLLMEFLIPGIRDLMYDASIGSVERMFQRGNTYHPGRRPSQRGGRTRYDRYSSRDSRDRDRGRLDRRDDRDDRHMSRRGRANFDFDEIILPSMFEAKETLRQMYDMMEKYESVSVADLYQIIGETPDPTDFKYGWEPEDLQGASVSNVRSGYLLNLPRPEQLD